MKQQIRVGVFETNSSSEHSISISNEMVILSEEEYEEYESGSLKITPKGEKISQRYTTKLISFGFFLFWSIVCIGSDARFVAL